MPSFLNKVFGYKKHDDKEVARPTRDAPNSLTLLDGKYEAILPILSPSSPTFPEAQSTKDPDREVGFSIFKPKIRGASQKLPVVAPHLTLQLPGPKENLDSRALGVVFEANPGSQSILDDAVIAAKRLNSLEALILIRACAQAITERGVETLGIMHPHWLSASPDVQRKLISLFIRSLTPQSRITTLSPTPTSPTSAFENELRYTRSPHDVAAVLRWGLRHLTLENGHFGKESAEWAWYTTFFHAERNASYPPKAFSELLLPQLPASHVELLTATLDMISSLASHAETNSISGSKLSKFLGIWLLVATRAEESDNWNRFYARWERAGRILEHLFLARLREESFGLRLPTRLQELVKYYPYNKGSPTTEDDLLSRPRFSTRQYDALCVRVETLLTHDAEHPKQHPIQLLLEAFQLPIENTFGEEHVALWNTLRTTVSEDATSSYPQGPQFTRIFVDETIQLLSSIPADNNVTSPTLLTSPITKVISRKRSYSLSKVLERALSKSNGNNGSTPVSPTSPSSAVITDWAQFSLRGFGDAPSTQPLVAPLYQDDDVEVTQPRISRKSSRQRGKSRSRRRQSEEREPSDALASSQLERELSIVETKLASVHVVQIDEAFIDFWSDAIVDPISTNWPTFVLCGLKEIPSVEQPIRWLVIEQAYSRQESQSPRNPSPDGRRGRSPRPSFKSDISGFRINSMFSSARKRFSVFSKSATDLDTKRSGAKTPITGELGEVLVEEECTFPSAPPTKVDQHVDGNVVVGATVTSGATAGIAEQLKVNESYATPITSIPSAALVSAVKEGSDSVHGTAKAPSVEPTPQSGGRYNGTSELAHSSVEQGSPRTHGFVNPRVDDTADPPTNIIAVAADMADLQTSDPMVLASRPTVENPAARDGRIQAEQFRQGVVVEAEVRPVELVPLPADGSERLPVEPLGEPSNVVQVDVTNVSREVVETVAMPPAPEVVVAKPITQSAVVAAVADDPPEPTAEVPHVGKQPSRKAPANVATSAAESVDQQEIDNLPPLFPAHAQDKDISIESRAQLAPDWITSVVDGDEEAKGVAELAEIPTPTPEHVALVEETLGPEVYADDYGRGGASQVPAAKLEALEDTVPQPVAAELQTTLEAEESSATHPIEVPSVEIVPAVDPDTQVVPVEAEHATDQVSEEATEEAQPSVQGPIVQAAEALQVDVSAGIVSAAQESVDVTPADVEAQAAPESFVFEARVVETQDMGAPTPALENAALVDETPSPEIATEEYEPVEAQPAIAPESEVVEDKVVESVVQAMPEAEAIATESAPLAEEAQSSIEAELPTQVLSEPLSAESIPEDATAALATVDDIIAVEAEAQPTPDFPTELPETHAPAPESASAEDTQEIAVEASKPVEVAPSAATDPKPVEDKATVLVIEEAQVLVEDAVTSASEPVANTPTVIIEEPVGQDVQAPIGSKELPSASAPQSADEAMPPAVDTADEEPQAVVEPAFLAPEVAVLLEEAQAVVDASEPETLAAEPELVEEAQAPVEAEELSSDVVGVPVEIEASTAAPTVEIDETSRVVEPQEGLDGLLAVTSEVDVSTQESAGPSEEVAPAEP